MPLHSGSRHGPYEITGLLGVGGMGEVYSARDTRLDRNVALKVIAAALSSDPDRVLRFQREAKALAALNHPHIASIYGLERTEAGEALVMELVEGPTLAERLGAAGAGLPMAEALAIATQIAEALEAAHEQNIVHRDLKPANVKVRADGTVKVLDFGLAKAMEPAPASPGSRQSAALTSPAVTEAGVILGTAAYMSPEQARGRLVDSRSDVWAFGCVLYEMLTGKRAFEGDAIAETFASVLGGRVDWSLLPPALSPVIRAFLVRCLEQDPRERLQDIADMRLALHGAFDAASVGHGPARALPWWRRALPLAAAVTIASVVTAFAVPMFSRSTVVPIVTRLQILLPPGQDFYFNGRHLVAISPDGTHVVYAAGLGLWLQPLDQLDARAVPGAELEGRSPFFSPDGRSIGYYAAGALRRVSITGGAPVAITPAVNPWGASWSADDSIYYGQGPDGIWKVAASGGTASQVIAVEPGQQAHGPQLLPDGEWVLFTLLPAGVGSWNRAQVVVQSLATNRREVLVDGGRDARYLPSGHLVYALGGDLLAAPFDPGNLRLAGGAFPVVRGVFDAGTVTGASHFAVAANGSLAYVPRSETKLQLTWVDRSGAATPISVEPRAYRHPRVSPDGGRIAAEVEDQEGLNIWIGDWRRGAFTRLTREDDTNSDPIWSPDGSRVVFTSVLAATGLRWQAADGSGTAELLTDSSGGVRAFSWTADGELLYEELEGADVRLLPIEKGARPRSITLFDAPEYFNEVLPALSPDGRLIAYQSTESGRMEIYVRPFPNVRAGRWQVSVGGGFAPLWSKDGREIFYRSTTSLMVVPVQTTPDFAAGTPVRLFGLGDFALAGTRGIRYDVAPDGRFLFLKDESGSGPRERIIVVQNWFEELRRLVPVR